MVRIYVYNTQFNETILLFIVRKRLHGEVYSPSFSARNIFCKSRFRSDEELYNQPNDDLMNDHQKEIKSGFIKDNKERNILMKVHLDNK